MKAKRESSNPIKRYRRYSLSLSLLKNSEYFLLKLCLSLLEIFFVDRNFHYPVFVTAVYMFFCALGGFLYFFLKWLVRVMRRDNSECYYMTWKYWMNIVRATYWLGIAFGIKLGVGNIGLVSEGIRLWGTISQRPLPSLLSFSLSLSLNRALLTKVNAFCHLSSLQDLVSVDYHVLFEATALAWVALLGYCLLNEKPSAFICLVIVTMATGQVLLSLQFTSEKQASLAGLVANLVSPTLQGICVVLTRYSALLLFPQWMTRHSTSSPGGAGRSSRGNSFRILNLSNLMTDYVQDFHFHLDTMIAFLCVKLFFSFLASMPAAIIKEGIYSDLPFWKAITKSNADLVASELAIGSVVTFLLQGSLVFLAMFSVALTLGILSVVKIVPQLAAGIWFSHREFQATLLHILGISLILFSSLAYMGAKISGRKKETDLS